MSTLSDASAFKIGGIGVVGGLITACCIILQPSVLHYIDSFPVPLNGFIAGAIMMISIIVNIGIVALIATCIDEIRHRRYGAIGDPSVHQREPEYLQILVGR